MMEKKGQLGLDTVKSVMIAFLVISVIGVTIILAVSSLGDVSDDIDQTTVTLAGGDDQTESAVTETGAYLTGASASLRNCAGSLTAVTNVTGSTITSGNYSLSGCLVIYEGTGEFNNTVWNVTGSYTYSNDNVEGITTNLSGAVTSFFSDTGTIFAILIVVVIILAIAIIIGVVSRFQGGGGTRSSGSLMGV